MRAMSWKEFYDSLIFRKDDIHIPVLSISIDKTKFVTLEGYNIVKQNEFLKEIYMSSLLLKE